MHDQPLLDQHLLNDLNRLSKPQAVAAIELLQHRLSFMERDDYYLSIPLTALPIPPRIQTHMRARQIHSVRELLLWNTDELYTIRGVGEKNLRRLKKMIVTLEERKDTLKDLTEEELYAAFS